MNNIKNIKYTKNTKLIKTRKNTKCKSRRISIRIKGQNYLRNLSSIKLLHTTTDTRRTHTMQHKLLRTHKYCDQKFGFIADPNYTHYANKAIVLQRTPTSQYFNPIINLTFHNLCTRYSPPIGTKQLLGLGHKFIPQRPLPKQNLYSTFTDFARNDRLKYTFSDNDHNTEKITKNDRKI